MNLQFFKIFPFKIAKISIAKKKGWYVANRSAVKDGEYLATFRLEQIIQVGNISYVWIFGNLPTRADYSGMQYFICMNIWQPSD